MLCAPQTDSVDAVCSKKRRKLRRYGLRVRFHRDLTVRSERQALYAVCKITKGARRGPVGVPPPTKDAVKTIVAVQRGGHANIPLHGRGEAVQRFVVKAGTGIKVAVRALAATKRNVQIQARALGFHTATHPASARS